MHSIFQKIYKKICFAMDCAINRSLLNSVIANVYLSSVITASARFVVILKFMSAVVSFVCLPSHMNESIKFMTAPERRSAYIDSMTDSMFCANILIENMRSTTRKGSDYFRVICVMKEKVRMRS